MFREPAKFWVNKGTLSWDRIPIFGIQVITESLTLGFGSLGNPNQFFNFEIFANLSTKILHFSTKPGILDYQMSKFSSIFQQNLVKFLQNPANHWRIPDPNLEKKIRINPKSWKGIRIPDPKSDSVSTLKHNKTSHLRTRKWRYRWGTSLRRQTRPQG